MLMGMANPPAELSFMSRQYRAQQNITICPSLHFSLCFAGCIRFLPRDQFASLVMRVCVCARTRVCVCSQCHIVMGGAEKHTAFAQDPPF